MPKFGCRCGNVINLSELPGPDEAMLVAEKTMEALASRAAECTLTQDALYGIVDAESPIVYLCRACGRIHVETAVQSGRFQSFAPERPQSSDGD